MFGLFDGFFGGGSGGNSTSSSSTSSIDKRMSLDGQSVGVSSDSSTVNILDAGAIKQAIDLAKNSTDINAKNYANTLEFAGAVYGSAFNILDSARKGVTATSDLVAKAYDNAKGAGDQKNTLFIMAVAVIALAVVGKIKL